MELTGDPKPDRRDLREEASFMAGEAILGVGRQHEPHSWSLSFLPDGQGIKARVGWHEKNLAPGWSGAMHWSEPLKLMLISSYDGC